MLALNQAARDRSGSNSKSASRRVSRTAAFGYFGRDPDDGPDENLHRRHRTSSVFEMSATEAAFLTQDVRERLAASAGQLPPVPAVFPRQGAVLFVDISGFTALGERLRATMSPEAAAERLARQITYVLNELTRICLNSGGDVSKFAGDALLCTFTGKSEDDALEKAENCAIDMLMGLRRFNLSSGLDTLQVHGGVSKGSILYFHLGSSDDDLRWSLIAGEAVAGATSLVDRAGPGQVSFLLSFLFHLRCILKRHIKFQRKETNALLLRARIYMRVDSDPG